MSRKVRITCHVSRGHYITHYRPWDSDEDISHPVVLTSSGCASGCASDHLPNARSTRDLQSARSHSTLVRSVPSLPGAGTLRHSTPVRPGYTHASTMPHIRSVSGEIRKDGEKIGSKRMFQVALSPTRLTRTTSLITALRLTLVTVTAVLSPL